MARAQAALRGGDPPWPLLRLSAATGVAWTVLAVALSPAPPARTVLVSAVAVLWTWQLAGPWRPPRQAVPLLALAALALLAAAPTTDADLAGFRPFPSAEGSFADGALAVATAPAWTHLVVLSRGRDLVWSVPLALALAPARHLLAGDFPLWPAWLMWGVGFMLLGAAFRIHGMLYEARLRLDREAVAEERRKIAREVHDLVGHGLGVTLLNLTAARLAVLRGDATAAVTALEEAERVGRQSVRDVHRGLVLLRDPSPPDHRASVAPAPPTAEDVRALVARFRAGGLAVDLTTRGDLSALDPAVGLTVFRIVQEALSNTARHAPGATAGVTIDLGGRHAEVTVDDAGAGTGGGRTPRGGFGLVGMRERVAALGGTLRTGPTPAGWRVRATIPTPGTSG
ncbi:sensor histidine kinase [Actinomadura xylanilytica]|uniref:sensor histidine kinase n=1 Tax=Actinomadura xylanilytica TaxID=887459 RepID=UPI00255B4005|nr:histidine kinase [Actinomadura xylanilytica]MDL4775943.1 histidine kinase [Actinomadura xylanilytica]